MKNIYKNIKIKLNILYSFIYHLFEKEYSYQGLVQFNENGKPEICGISIRWLEEIQVKAITEKKAICIACTILNKKYPEYNDMIQLF